MLVYPTQGAEALDTPNNEGRTVLMYAAMHGLSRVVEQFVATGAKCELTNSNGLTALLLACVQGHIDTVELLVTPTAAAGALDVQNDNGYSALMCAADRELCAVVEELTKAGAKPGVTDKGGMTALALACVLLVNDVPLAVIWSGELGHQRECLGVYSLVERTAHGRLVWKHASNDRWIAKRSTGYWVVQQGEAVGVNKFCFMELPDHTAMLPHQSSNAWVVWCSEAWIEAPTLMCEGPSEVNHVCVCVWEDVVHTFNHL